MVAPMIATTPATTSQAAAKTMKFSKSSLLLPTGSSKKVLIKNYAKGSTYSWKSSNKKVATATADKKSARKAMVKVVGAGTAKITCAVKKSGKTTTVSGLTVKGRQKVTSFSMQDTSSKSKTNAELNVGEKLVLKGAINNNASGSTTNQTVTWSSSNSKVASVKKKNVNQATITAKSAGSVTITAVVAPKSKTDKKSATCTVKVSESKVVATATPKPGTTAVPSKPTATPKTYPKGTVYKQENTVTRWYNPGTNQGYSYDGYKNNTFAIWMVGFFDNPYSTNDSNINTGYGPDLSEYKGTALNLSGQFKYEGTAQNTVLLQLNYTKPSDYPIVWKWEKGASKSANEYAKELSISGVNGSENVAPETWTNVDVTFTIPTAAVNGDKDDATGNNFGIYLYFPNKPGGALAYVKSNTFHFRNFWVKEK